MRLGQLGQDRTLYDNQAIVKENDTFCLRYVPCLAVILLNSPKKIRLQQEFDGRGKSRLSLPTFEKNPEIFVLNPRVKFAMQELNLLLEIIETEIW